MERWGTGAAPSGRTCLLAPSILTPPSPVPLPPPVPTAQGQQCREGWGQVRPTQPTPRRICTPPGREKTPRQVDRPRESWERKGLFSWQKRALHLHFAPGLQGLAKEWIPGWGHRRDWALEQTN